MDPSVTRLSRAPGAWFARVTSAVAFAGVLGIVVFVDQLEMQSSIALDEERLRILAEEFATHVSSEVVQRLDLTRGLGAVAQADPDFAQDRFEDLASDLLGDLEGVISLQLAPGGVVRRVTDQDRNSAVMGLDLFSSARDSAAARAAVLKRGMVVQGPFELAQGGTGVVGRQPIFRPEVVNVTGSSDFWGFATVVFSIDAIVEAAASAYLGEDIPYLLVAGAASEYTFGPTPLSSADGPRISVPVALPEGTEWRVEISRSGALSAELLFWRPWLWALGLVSAALASWIVARIFSFQSELQAQVDLATRELSHALRQAQVAEESAASANKAKSEFLRNVSHEFRTPLNGILGYAGVLVDHPESELSETQARWVENIEGSGRHLLTLVERLLLVSSGQQRADEDDIEPLLIAPIVSECVELIRPHAEARSLRVENTVDESNALSVMASSIFLRQVLLNLLSNAVKYNCEGGLIRVGGQTVPPGRLRVTVEDTGHGLSEEEQGVIFEPFRRVAEGGKPGVDGFGLGLFITRDLVARMGGEVGVTSHPGEGSSFWFEVRLAEQGAS